MSFHNELTYIFVLIGISLNILFALAALNAFLNFKKKIPNQLIFLGIISGLTDALSLLAVYFFKDNSYLLMFYSLIESLIWLNYFLKSDSIISKNKILTNYLRPLIYIYLIVFLFDIYLKSNSINNFDGYVCMLWFLYYIVNSFLAFYSIYNIVQKDKYFRIMHMPELYINIGVLIYFFSGIFFLTFRKFINVNDIKENYINFNITEIFYEITNILYCIFLIISFTKFSRQENEIKLD